MGKIETDKIYCGQVQHNKSFWIPKSII